MRLDIDCVRDVLMAVEQKGFGQSYTISNLHDLLDYSSDQIEYTCLKLSGYHHSTNDSKNYAWYLLCK